MQERPFKILYFLHRVKNIKHFAIVGSLGVYVHPEIIEEEENIANLNLFYGEGIQSIHTNVVC